MRPDNARATLHNHTFDEIRTLLSGLGVVDPPGLVDARHWTPQAPARALARADAGRILAVVARTPAS